MRLTCSESGLVSRHRWKFLWICSNAPRAPQPGFINRVLHLELETALFNHILNLTFFYVIHLFTYLKYLNDCVIETSVSNHDSSILGGYQFSAIDSKILPPSSKYSCASRSGWKSIAITFWHFSNNSRSRRRNSVRSNGNLLPL